MKKYVQILIFTIGSFCFSQTQEMLDTTWYLHNLEIDNIDYAPPVNSDTSFIEVEFNQDNMQSGICSGMNCELENFNNNDFIINETFFVLIECNNPESENYELLYFSEFYLSNLSDKLFIYEIIDGTISPRTLIITNENGDKAFYGNTILLNNNNFETKKTILYPNPIKGLLNINAVNGIQELEIFTSSGQLVLKKTGILDKSAINTEGLTPGIYFVKITQNDGTVSTQKVVKE